MSTIRITIDHGRGRRHIAVVHSRAGWQLAQAIPTRHGHRFEYPWPEVYRTKREALEAKRGAAR